MKKLFLLLIPFLFISCWIDPNYSDFEHTDNEWLFQDYRTMRAYITPEINKTFTAWHWSNSKFDEKYQQYLNNTDFDSEAYSKLHSDYTYYVKRGYSNETVTYYNDSHVAKKIKRTYFLIISSDQNCVVFFEE